MHVAQRVTFHEQNQQNTLAIVKRVKYSKAGSYPIIKLLSRIEYKNDHAILTAQKVKVFH